ncbi:hypothetical protein [Aquimarina sediminis]|uniref:hypothetical protein n=1 Tax=Aquimarina sediminis TaxID=2070536 RepID=UPI000CA02E33|nr:hypothetical protein [Aquimarina sediminis]
MEPLKELYLSKKMANQYLYMGVAALVLGLLALVSIGNGTLLGLGTLFTTMGMLNRNLKIVKIYSQYLEIKLGIIASKKLMKYDQITSFSIDKKAILIQYKTEKNESKKVKFLIKALEKEDLLELDKILQDKTDLDASNTIVQADVSIQH